MIIIFNTTWSNHKNAATILNEEQWISSYLLAVQEPYLEQPQAERAPYPSTDHQVGSQWWVGQEPVPPQVQQLELLLVAKQGLLPPSQLLDGTENRQKCNKAVIKACHNASTCLVLLHLLTWFMLSCPSKLTFVLVSWFFKVSGTECIQLELTWMWVESKC